MQPPCPPKPRTRRTRTAERAGLALVAAPLLAILVLLVGTSGAQQGRPDVVTSDNVTFIKTIPEASDGVGARVVGNRLFVTTTKDLLVYDISDPANPKNVGGFNVNIEFENEEVPSNGKLLGISGQYGGCAPVGAVPVIGTNCLSIYDVSGTTPKPLDVVANAGDHTATCILDCTWFYGSEGVIVDARNPSDAKRVMDPDGTERKWFEGLEIPPEEISGFDCHHQNEIAPGIIVGACQPLIVVSVREEDGASPTDPKLLARYDHEDERFIHGVRWPNGGGDRFLLAGGETNFQEQCHPDVGAFMVFDTTRKSPQGDWTETDEVRPQNGDYQDSWPTVQALGCSVHWFEEHQSFRDGGLVALAEYEAGTRFLQITPEGTIRQLGFFLPIGGSTSAPHWAPDGRHVYNIDYTRGLDVLRYDGPLVVPENGKADRPPQATAPGEQPLPEAGAASVGAGGSGSGRTTPVACASTAGFTRVAASSERISVVRRRQEPFTVELFRQSKGRRVVDRRVRRYRAQDSGIALPNRAAPGFYFARLRMELPGTDDVRRVALLRRGGRWIVRPDHYLRETCGALSAFKLERTVFGGRRGVPLRIAYRLPSGVDRVRLEVLRGGKVVRTIRGATARNRSHRYRVPASIARAGTDVKVRIVVERSGARVSETLTSRRL